jgi:hypothetical protein
MVCEDSRNECVCDVVETSEQQLDRNEGSQEDEHRVLART